jgi:hypothetical protein
LHRSPGAQLASLVHALPLVPDPAMVHVRCGPQYSPAEHSSLMVHGVPAVPQPQGAQVPEAPHIRPGLHVIVPLQAWPTPCPAGTIPEDDPLAPLLLDAVVLVIPPSP